MQTQLIKNTKTFSEFEKNFIHFFSECERGFTNELIMNLYYRSFTENHEVISYGRQVNEVFFISSGRVQVSFDADNDLKH